MENIWYNAARSPCLCPDPPRPFPPRLIMVPTGGRAAGTQGLWRCRRAGRRGRQGFRGGWA